MKILFNIPHEDYIMRGMHVMGNVYSLKKIPMDVINVSDLFKLNTGRLLSQKAIDRIMGVVKDD